MWLEYYSGAARCRGVHTPTTIKLHLNSSINSPERAPASGVQLFYKLNRIQIY